MPGNSLTLLLVSCLPPPLLSQMWGLHRGRKPLPAFSYFLPIFLHRCFLKQIFSWVLLREPKLVPSIQIFKWSEERAFGDVLLHWAFSLFLSVAKNQSEKTKHLPPYTQKSLLLEGKKERNSTYTPEKLSSLIKTNLFHLQDTCEWYGWILTHCWVNEEAMKRQLRVKSQALANRNSKH